MSRHQPADSLLSGGQADSRLAGELGEVAIRGGAIRVIGYVGGVSISLGAAAILVRHLGISGFGRYITVISLIALVGGVTEAGIAVYGIREFGASSDPDRRRLMADLLGMRLAVTSLGIACVIVFGLVAGYSGVLVLGTLVAGIGLLFQVVADVLSIPLQSKLLLGRLTAVDVTRRLIALLLIAGLAIAGARLLPFFAISIASGAVALLLLARMVRASITLSVSWDWTRWRALFAETLPFALAVSIGAVYFYVTIIVMSLIASALQTGFFATSFRVTQVALAIPAIALTAIFPLMTREQGDRGDQLDDTMGKVLDVAVIFGIWMSLSMAIGAGFIIDVLAGGHRGHGAVSVLRIQGLVLTASFVSVSSMFGLLALRRYRQMLAATSSALALNIILGLILIPSLGARGGAIADVSTETVMAAGLTIALVRALPRHGITAAIVPSLLIATAVAASVWLLPVGAVASVVLATILYFGVLLIMGSVPDEVTRVARRLRAARGRL
jgi:O-antigen/teichoic acid export membrane protein